MRVAAGGASKKAAGWLPFTGLLVALSSVFLFVDERDHFYRSFVHDSNSAKNMALAENLSARRGFLFIQITRGDDGARRYALYNRFPIGGFVLIKLAMLPFEGDLSAQIVAARVLMLAFFCAGAVLAYLALVRLLGCRWIALAATLLAFSSYYMLDYNDIVSNEVSMDLCAVLLVFHGMVVFAQEGRFWPLLAKTGVALLIGWHVYALLLPFLAIGLAGELPVAWRNASASLGGRLAAVSRCALRSRHTRLGALALLFGACMVGYNLAQEYAVLEGKRALSDLPSARSILRRAGGDASFKAARAELLAWPNFLQWQFHRVGGMSLPYLVPAPRNALGELPQERSGEASLFWVGLAATGACLAGLVLLRRRGLLLAPLAFAGFCWAWPLRAQTGIPGHDHEAVFYIGVPLVVFASLLLGARKLAARRHRRIGRLLAGGIGVLTVPGFAFCALAMAQAGRDAEAAVEQRALMADFEAIRDATRGRDVFVAANRAALDRLFKVQSAFYYYVAGGILTYEVPGRSAPRDADFVLATRRVENRWLRTPGNRFVFLYDSLEAFDALNAVRRRDYDALAAGAPVARSVWQLHLRGNTGSATTELAYLKQPCNAQDINGQFSLRVYPVRIDDLPAPRRRAGFDAIAFGFGEYGVMFDNKCLIAVPLPRYEVAWMAARYLPSGGAAGGWETTIRLDLDSLRSAYESARRLPAVGSGRFRVHHDGGKLVYVKTPCGEEDVRGRFFVHVRPAAVRDLPPMPRRAGFANLDFNFHERGAVLDGACVAVVTLPGFPVARVETGQLDREGGQAWRAAFAIE